MNLKHLLQVSIMSLFILNFASAIVYEDAEAVNSAEKWYVYDNSPSGMSVNRTYDGGKNSHVITLSGSGTDNGYMNGSFDNSLSWNNSSDTLLSWDMKYSESFIIYVRLTTQNGFRYLYYTASDVDYGKSNGSSYIHFGLGSTSKNGNWHTFTRDLVADLHEFEPNNVLLATHAFLIRGSGSLDNITLKSTPLNSKKALILYDTAGIYGHTGKVNAIFLENLLGHFNLEVTSKPANEYVINEMDGKRAVFYLGTTYDVLSNYSVGSTAYNAYKNFYKDVATKNTTVVWINYNLNALAQSWIDDNLNPQSFVDKFGFTFSGVNQGKYNRINYKNIELFKGVIPFATPGADIQFCADEGSNKFACALEVNQINIVHANQVDIFSTTYSTLAGGAGSTPYITKGAKLWFVGDVPFSYMSEEDRYLAFSDVLHDMLQIPHEENHKALMRLEDVDARTNLNDLTKISNYMRSANAPFSVATIPIYEDPLGIENNGLATEEFIYNSVIGTTLKNLYDEGLIGIVHHGTTHQHHVNIGDLPSEINNPYNGVSGNDFEFMRVTENADLSLSYEGPTHNDSKQWAKDRMILGKNVLSQLGVTAFAWEAPHYMAGPNHYRGIREVYASQYARMLYYPNENSADLSKKYKFIGQFFPYVIQKDLYGYKIIPEDIHNIEDVPNAGYRPLLPADTIRFAKKLKVVRDGVASFFYHPYLGKGYLQQIVEGLKSEGYEFVPASTLIQ